MAGGDSYNKTSIYETTTNAWTPGTNLQIGRGYQVGPGNPLPTRIVFPSRLSIFKACPKSSTIIWPKGFPRSP